MSKKDKVDYKDAGLSSRSMTCSADAHQENAERETPEQIAGFIVLKAFIHSSDAQMKKSLLKSIAAAIREAVKLEREECAKLADDLQFQGDWDCYKPEVALEIRNRK